MDILVSLLLIAIIGSALLYVINKKKKGVQCIGCPDSGTCTTHKKKSGETAPTSCACSHCDGCCGHHNHE